MVQVRGTVAKGYVLENVLDAASKLVSSHNMVKASEGFVTALQAVSSLEMK